MFEASRSIIKFGRIFLLVALFSGNLISVSWSLGQQNAERSRYLHPDIYHQRFFKSLVQWPQTIDINQASHTELQNLPNVDADLALKIIRLRRQHPIQSVADLESINGIDPKRLHLILKPLHGKIIYNLKQ